jgi:hypothetical protein
VSLECYHGTNGHENNEARGAKAKRVIEPV